MSHYIDNNKIVFNNALVLNDGKTVNDYILVSDANGVVRWDATTNYVSSKEFDHFVGEWFGGGVVVAVWKEEGLEKCLVAAPQDCSFVGTQRYSDQWPPNYLNYPFLGFEVPWSNVDLTSGASYSVSGLSNSNIVVAQPGFSTTINPFQDYENDSLSGYSGAAQYALNYINPDLGSGIFNDWYLPAAHEIITLWNNASAVNRALAEYADYNSVSTSPNFGAQVNSQINLFGLNADNSGSGYWTSTEASATEAYYLSNNGSILKAIKKEPAFTGDLSKFKRVRPFRIASDNQVSFNFEADWMILTYKFVPGLDVPDGAGARDLDTYTVFSYPTTLNPGSKVGHLAGFTGGWDPVFGTRISITDPAAFNANNDLISDPTLISNTLIFMGGDNTGTGLETVLINVSRFKQLYPNESYFTIDARCAWWIGNFVPQIPVRTTQYPGLTATPTAGTITAANDLGYNAQSLQYWLNLTEPVVVGVELFKGGKPRMDTVKTWTVANPTKYLNVDSFSKKIPNARYDTNLAAQIKYEVAKKLCTLIKV